VISDQTNRRVLDVLESREKATVGKYVRDGQQHGRFAPVREVTTDMGDA